MSTATRPHGGRGKRYEPDTTMTCEQCDEVIPAQISAICADCEAANDAEWDEFWAECDSPDEENEDD